MPHARFGSVGPFGFRTCRNDSSASTDSDICISSLFSCYRRLPLLASATSRHVFTRILGEVRDRYGFKLVGYVVMPEHIHLLISEPHHGNPSTVLKMLKQRVSPGSGVNHAAALQGLNAASPLQRPWGACQDSARRASTISMSGAKRRKLRSSPTCTQIQSNAAWWNIRRIGPGAGMGFTRSVDRFSSRSIQTETEQQFNKRNSPRSQTEHGAPAKPELTWATRPKVMISGGSNVV